VRSETKVPALRAALVTALPGAEVTRAPLLRVTVLLAAALAQGLASCLPRCSVPLVSGCCSTPGATALGSGVFALRGEAQVPGAAAARPGTGAVGCGPSAGERCRERFCGQPLATSQNHLEDVPGRLAAPRTARHRAAESQGQQHRRLQVLPAVRAAGTSRPAALPKPWSSAGWAEASAWWEPGGEARAGGVVLTPLSAPRHAAPLQPSASAESKSQASSWRHRCGLPPLPPGPGAALPPLPSIARGDGGETDGPELTEHGSARAHGSGQRGGHVLVGNRPSCSCHAELQHQ